MNVDVDPPRRSGTAGATRSPVASRTTGATGATGTAATIFITAPYQRHHTQSADADKSK